MNADDRAWQAMTPQQQGVVKRVLGEESARRRSLVVSLSGAHAYGFPSPDSDVDLKAVHLSATERILGFPRSEAAAERLEVIDGIEIDYSSNELGHVLAGVMKGNGNYLERFLSGYALESSPELEELRPLVQASLSKRIFRHYLGFANQQRLEWEKSGRRSAKKLLYVLRTTLTGTHALLHHEVVTDVTILAPQYGFADALELVEQKRRGEKSELPDELAAPWTRRLPEAFSRLEQACADSALPEAPPNEEELERWLIRTRIAALPGPGYSSSGPTQNRTS
ncbi:MAG: nucleotidyltransferase domain-containing protein [Myxococcaceae bacterium]